METPPIPTIPSIPQRQKTRHFSTIVLIALVLVGLVAGGLIGFAVTYSNFNSRLNTLQTQLQSFAQNPTNIPYQTPHIW
jgi:flagellar basal body-associated protein FliL